jgi:glutamyl-tRNA synthetase
MRGRYAPSPTGRLHLGNARTALLAWLQTRHAGGTFIMRVEDLDPQRSREALVEEQLADLRWLGLDWDEGPDLGGPSAPYRQSRRSEVYAEAAARLQTFPCTCSRKELREATLAPHGSEPVYPGTCREGPSHPERRPALRWKTPPGRVEFADLILGHVAQDMEEVGDFVLRRSDGAWAYQLAVVVDDAAMEVDHVLRGADLIESTPRQIHLQRALGLPTPVYAHAPLVVGRDGTKLNKRHGAPNLTALREGGADSLRVLAALARSAGLIEASTDRIQARELVERWDPAKIPSQDGAIDLEMA